MFAANRTRAGSVFIRPHPPSRWAHLFDMVAAGEIFYDFCRRGGKGGEGKGKVGFCRDRGGGLMVFGGVVWRDLAMQGAYMSRLVEGWY